MKTVTIPSILFSANRKHLADKLRPGSLAIIHSNDEMNRTADQFYPYRQNSDLFYLTGINQEKTVLLMAPGFADKTMEEVLFIRKSDPRLETWEGHKLTTEEAGMISGISQIKYTDDLDSILANYMVNCNRIYLNLPENHKFIVEMACRNLRMAETLRIKYPAHSYERLAPVMRELRMIKSETELALMKEACSITGQAFLRLLPIVKPGVTEYEIEAELTYDFIRKGARGHAYAPIVASGSHACILHYTDNNSPCAEGNLLLMDFGAEYGNYAADCTRTIPVSGKFTSRQLEIYNSVLDVFRYASSLIKPGNTINAVHADVVKRFGQEHVKLGLYTAEMLDKQMNDQPLYHKYYMHGTCHFLGLDVHDVGSKDAPFRPGMVLTCEPAIYIADEGIGIRLENNLVVTEKGNTDLMADIPIEPHDIEQLMKG